MSRIHSTWSVIFALKDSIPLGLCTLIITLCIFYVFKFLLILGWNRKRALPLHKLKILSLGIVGFTNWRGLSKRFIELLLFHFNLLFLWHEVVVMLVASQILQSCFFKLSFRRQHSVGICLRVPYNRHLSCSLLSVEPSVSRTSSHPTGASCIWWII